MEPTTTAAAATTTTARTGAVKRARYEDKTVPTPGHKTTREIASEQYFWPFISLYEREVVLKKAEEDMLADMDLADPDPEWICERNGLNYLMRVRTWRPEDWRYVCFELCEAYEELVQEIIDSHKPVIVK